MKSPKISDKNLFYNTVKRNLPMMLLFFVGMLIVIDVSTILVLSRMNDGASFQGYFVSDVPKSDLQRKFVVEFAEGLGEVIEFASAMCAIFAGCITMRYLMNKKSAILFGSIPQKRTNQFFSSYFAGVTSFLVPLAVTVGTAFLLISVNGYSSAILPMTAGILRGIIWFFFFMSLTCAVGMLCGMSSIQFLGVCTVLAYLPIGLVLLSGYMSVLDYNINFDYYFNIETLGKLSPFCRLIDSIGSNPLGVASIVAYCIASAVLVAIAVALYTIRDNSKAGVPIAFDKVSSVIKYMLMAICTATFGIMFYGISASSLAWLFIGCIIGAFVSFMLMNVILFKNSRAFFARPKGFGVFCGVFALLLVFMVFDPLGVKTYTPERDNVSSVDMLIANNRVTFKEKENIDRIYNIISGSEIVDNFYIYDDIYYEDESADIYTDKLDEDEAMLREESDYHTSLTVVSKLGVPRQVNIKISNVDKYRDDFLSLIESEEYKDKAFDSFRNGGVIHGDLVTKIDAGLLHESIRVKEGINEVTQEYMEESGGKIIHDDKGPVVITLTTNDGYKFPIYLEYRKTLEKLLKYNDFKLEGVCPTADTADDFLSKVKSLKTLKNDKLSEITDKEQIAEIYKDSVGFEDIVRFPSLSEYFGKTKKVLIELEGDEGDYNMSPLVLMVRE